MNNSQKKIVVIACFVFSPIFVIIGLFGESAFVGLILPIASIFAGFYFWNSNVNYVHNRQITYEEYANAILPKIVKNVAIGFVEAIITELQKDDSTKHISEDELKQFIISNFSTLLVKNDFIEIIRKNYTNDEFQFMANNALSDMGMKLQDKSHLLTKEFENLLKPEMTRVCDLVEEKYNLYE